LLCLLSTLQSIFPRDSRLGVDDDWSTVNRKKIPYRITNVTPTATTEDEKMLMKQAMDEVFTDLTYKWKCFFGQRRLPKDEFLKNELYVRLKELAEAMMNRWKFRRKDLKKLCETTKKNYDARLKRRDEAINTFQELKNRLKTLETDLQKIKKGTYRISKDGQYRKKQTPEEKEKEKEEEKEKIQEIKAQIEEEIIDVTAKKQEAFHHNESVKEEIKKNPIYETKDLFSKDYIDCHNELKRLKHTFRNKQNLILNMKEKGSDVSLIQKERRTLSSIHEDICVLKPIHDDLLREEYKEILKGNRPSRSE
jgi:hypothetical protein